MIDTAQRPEYLQYVETVLGIQFHTPVKTLTSLSQSGTILGVVAFHRFQPGNCELTLAGTGEGWLKRSLMKMVAEYAFNQLSCRRITAIVAVGNVKSFNLAQQSGFRMEGYLKDWFPSGDAYIMGLYRDNCHWLKGNFYGRRYPDSTGSSHHGADSRRSE